jgi:hypothetical protein
MAQDFAIPVARPKVQRHEKAKWRRSDPRHLFAENQAGNGFFYSVNV